MTELDLPREDRYVKYISISSRGSASIQSIRSEDIGQIAEDFRLRNALELADIVQNIYGDIDPERVFAFRGFIRARYKTVGCIGDTLHSVATDFPDDTYDQLKKWLDENN